MRRLDPAEAALWAKVMASVRPLRAARIAALPPPPPPVPAIPAQGQPGIRPPKGRVPPPRQMPPATPAPRTIDGSLDNGWERRIGRGQLVPDSSIDLHGHSLAEAHRVLDDGLARALGRGDRVLLLVTGRPPRPESERPHARGAIRAAVKDWLAMSRHADAIAAVRGAHPRHGGAGALYIILRRTTGHRHR
jgi:DNA-nicking Smr family endonuclease